MNTPKNHQSHIDSDVRVALVQMQGQLTAIAEKMQLMIERFNAVQSEQAEEIRRIVNIVTGNGDGIVTKLHGIGNSLDDLKRDYRRTEAIVGNHEASVVASANEIAELKKSLGDTQKILADYEKNEIAFVRTQMMRQGWLAGIGSHLVGYLATVVITALFMTWYASHTYNNSQPKEDIQQVLLFDSTTDERYWVRLSEGLEDVKYAIELKREGK